MKKRMLSDKKSPAKFAANVEVFFELTAHTGTVDSPTLFFYPRAVPMGEASFMQVVDIILQSKLVKFVVPTTSSP